jgi:hypothetical protein
MSLDKVGERFSQLENSIKRLITDRMEEKRRTK